MKKFAVDFMKKEIVVSATTLRKTRVIDSAEYEMMLRLTNELPNFRIAVQQLPTRTCRRYQPTYTQMENIICMKAEDPASALEEFNTIRRIALAHKSPYHHVLRWFMNKYHTEEKMAYAA